MLFTLLVSISLFSNVLSQCTINSTFSDSMESFDVNLGGQKYIYGVISDNWVTYSFNTNSGGSGVANGTYSDGFASNQVGSTGQFAFLEGSANISNCLYFGISQTGSYNISWIDSGRIAGSDYDGVNQYQFIVYQLPSLNNVMISSTYATSSNSAWTFHFEIFNIVSAGNYILSFTSLQIGNHTSFIDSIQIVFNVHDVTSSSITTSPATTSQVTSASLSSGSLTSSQMTTAEYTTSQITTSQVTTSQMTTSQITTSPTASSLTSNSITTNSQSTSSLTSSQSSSTTSQLTTTKITSAATNAPSTTSQMTSANPVTSSFATTSQLATNQITSSAITSASAVTTSQLTTSATIPSCVTAQSSQIATFENPISGGFQYGVVSDNWVTVPYSMGDGSGVATGNSSTGFLASRIGSTGQFAFLSGFTNISLCLYFSSSQTGPYTISWTDSGRISGVGYDGVTQYQIIIYEYPALTYLATTGLYNTTSGAPWITHSLAFKINHEGYYLIAFNTRSRGDHTAYIDNINIQYSVTPVTTSPSVPPSDCTPYSNTTETFEISLNSSIEFGVVSHNWITFNSNSNGGSGVAKNDANGFISYGNGLTGQYAFLSGNANITACFYFSYSQIGDYSIYWTDSGRDAKTGYDGNNQYQVFVFKTDGTSYIESGLFYTKSNADWSPHILDFEVSSPGNYIFTFVSYDNAGGHTAFIDNIRIGSRTSVTSGSMTSQITSRMTTVMATTVSRAVTSSSMTSKTLTTRNLFTTRDITGAMNGSSRLFAPALILVVLILVLC